VLGIEPFRRGHERGGSQDDSRIIRLAQHQPQYAAPANAAVGINDFGRRG
jgi:sarcosine oxidase